MFFDLKKLLHTRLRQHGVGEAVEAARTVEAFRQVLAELMGESAVSSLRKVAFRNSTLEILCGSGALAAELRMREIELLEKLASKLETNTIRLRIFG